MKNQEQKLKKKFYKCWWFWVFVVVFLIATASNGKPQQKNNEPATNNPVVVANTETGQENQQEIDVGQTTITTPEAQTTVRNETTAVIEKEPVQTEQPAPITTGSQYTYYSVSSIIDGDTIKINMGGKTETLRLIGIDTPETVDPRKPVQCFGKEASNKAKELLSGKRVRIEMDSTQDERDKYDRLLAYVYRDDGLFYNKYMIEQGYAHEYTYDTPYKYQTEFKAAQKAAQTAQAGLWSPNTCNGDTTSSTTPLPQTTTDTPSSVGKYYTSSYYTSKYYYPESCDGWKTLSPNYLKSFDSLGALLVTYPSRTLSPQCQ